MKTMKEITPKDFLTFTKAGNVVVTDPVTGREFICYHIKDNTFLHSLTNENVTAEEITAVILHRIDQAEKMEAEYEAKKAAAQKAEAEKAAKGTKTAKRQAPKQQAKNFCMHCGAPLTPGDKFCMNCGEKL